MTILTFPTVAEAVACRHCGSGDVTVSTSIRIGIQFGEGVNVRGPLAQGPMPGGFAIVCPACGRGDHVTEHTDPLWPVLAGEFGQLITNMWEDDGG